MKIKNTISALWASAAALAASAVPALAQAKVNIPKAGDIGIGVGENLTLGNLISTLIRLLVVVAAVVFFIWLLLGGIRWITSGGDKQKTEEARAQITAALVGLVIVFAAWAIAQLIKVLFQFDVFNLEIRQIGT